MENSEIIQNCNIPDEDFRITITKVELKEFPKLWVRPKRREQEFLTMQKEIASIVEKNSLKRFKESSCQVDTLCLVQNCNVGLANSLNLMNY